MSYFLAFIIVVLIVYIIWLRISLKYSKARFALSVLFAILLINGTFFIFLNSSGVIAFLNILLSFVSENTDLTIEPIKRSSWDIGQFILAFFMSSISLLCLIRFAIKTIESWPGETTVLVSELAKEHRENELLSLSKAEIVRIFSGSKDPLASDEAINWEHKLTSTPQQPKWNILCKELFEAKYPEADFPEQNAWRASSNVWVGEIYSKTCNEKKHGLLLFALEHEPTDESLNTLIESFTDGLTLEKRHKIYVVFDSDVVIAKREVKIKGLDLEIWSKKDLLHSGLELEHYARGLIKLFDEGLTSDLNIPLKSSFTPAHVIIGNKKNNRKNLSGLLKAWSVEVGSRHLAITGEYGQGKSTSMLDFCVVWARKYLKGEALNDKVPLLIELRGKDPAGVSRESFIASWADRHHLAGDQVMKLIMSGGTILIFEGFDELRNAGREFDRHEHFNALWLFAYPGTKLIFTGRPNFFLDDSEKNRTLRSCSEVGDGGGAYTELWQLDKLQIAEIENICRGFEKSIGSSIVKAAKEHDVFFDIVSRPSMIPVVAAIWPEIQSMQKEGQNLTGALLIEHYLKAVYARKLKEIEEDRIKQGTLKSVSYLLLPIEVREALTLAIVWKMASMDARNTISRKDFSRIVSSSFDAVFIAFKSKGVRQEIVNSMVHFEERFIDHSKGDRIEFIVNEIATAGVFVSDPVGGLGNLRLPHKQYYEYLIAKSFWIIKAKPKSLITEIIRGKDYSNPIKTLFKEKGSVKYIVDIMGNDFSILKTRFNKLYLKCLYTSTFMSILLTKRLLFSADKKEFRESDLIRESSLMIAALCTAVFPPLILY